MSLRHPVVLACVLVTGAVACPPLVALYVIAASLIPQTLYTSPAPGNGHEIIVKYLGCGLADCTTGVIARNGLRSRRIYVSGDSVLYSAHVAWTPDWTAASVLTCTHITLPECSGYDFRSRQTLPEQVARKHVLSGLAQRYGLGQSALDWSAQQLGNWCDKQGRTEPGPVAPMIAALPQTGR